MLHEEVDTGEGSTVSYTPLGDAGRAEHRFGEGAQAHHIKHHKHGGDDSESNCVILCWSCHYSVHEGGRYRTGSVDGKPSDYLHYYGA